MVAKIFREPALLNGSCSCASVTASERPGRMIGRTSWLEILFGRAFRHVRPTLGRITRGRREQAARRTVASHVTGGRRRVQPMLDGGAAGWPPQYDDRKKTRHERTRRNPGHQPNGGIEPAS